MVKFNNALKVLLLVVTLGLALSHPQASRKAKTRTDHIIGSTVSGKVQDYVLSINLYRTEHDEIVDQLGQPVDNLAELLSSMNEVANQLGFEGNPSTYLHLIDSARTDFAGSPEVYHVKADHRALNYLDGGEVSLRSGFCDTAKFPRDRYLRFESCGKSHHYYTFNGTAQCPEDMVFKQELKTSNLAVKGGNLHVMGDFAFIGYNVMMDGYQVQNYHNTESHKLAVQNRLEQLGYDGTNPDSIQAKIEAELGKDVIWVGTEKRMTTGNHDTEYDLPRDVQRFWVPYYHLDMYFIPLGLDEASRIVTYAVAYPDSDWQNPRYYNSSYANGKFKHRVDSFRKSIDSTISFVNLQLKRALYDAEVIKLPMYIVSELRTEDGAFESVLSPVNGILENKVYHMPFDCRYESDKFYYRAHSLAMGSLRNVKITVNEVSSYRYTGAGALHCMVYEKHRTYP